MGFQLQMSWQPSLLSHKRKTVGPLGLKNLGNSCYLNSVLQCLTYTPPLANFCLRSQHSSLCDSVVNGEKRDCPFCILERRIARSLSVDFNLDAPAKIQSCLRIFAEHFKCGRQEDAHEFLRYVIDACHNTCLRLMKLRRKGLDNSSNGISHVDTGNDNASVVKEIFGGALQSQVKCLSCNSESNKVDEIMDISLDVLRINSLREAMQKFFQPEILDGSNKYRCEICKKLVAARKQMSVLEAPNILVIQLKRFEGVFGSKIDKAIAFEEGLAISSYMCKGSQDPRPEYHLFGTIVHSGYSPESGHYYAYIKDAMGQWYCCNDSYVTRSTLKDVLSEKVYILFFSRTNQKRASAGGSGTLNGGKQCSTNGSEASKNSKFIVEQKAEPSKLCVEQSSDNDFPSVSKVDNVLSSTKVKFNVRAHSVARRVTPTFDGKTNCFKSQTSKLNKDKDKISVEDQTKDMPSIINGNSCNKNWKVDDGEVTEKIGKEKAHENGLIQNGGFDSVSSTLYKYNGTVDREPAENGTVHHKLQNGVNSRPSIPESYKLQNGVNSRPSIPESHKLQDGVNSRPSIPESKRKLEWDSCSLLAQDAESQAKVQELLEREALTVLQSCGWSEKVHSFMSSRKRLCAQGRNFPIDVELKKLLIAEAKPIFIAQIPESLKQNLVKRLQSFGRGK